MKQSSSVNPILLDFVKALLLPTIVGKCLIYYFGLMYSSYPDEGYGYGLALSITFTVGNLLRFLWKYRHIQDP